MAVQPPGAYAAPPPPMPQNQGSYGAPAPMQAPGVPQTAYGAPPPGHYGAPPHITHHRPAYHAPSPMGGPPPGFGYAPPPPAAAGGWAPPPAPPAHHPSGSGADMEGAIAQLASMGFPRDRAVDALRKSGNDVAGAANSLLSGP